MQKELTQAELIIEYLKECMVINPAKMGGVIFKGQMFGSETTKRCREMRAKGILESVEDGKFVKYFLKRAESAIVLRVDKDLEQGQLFSTAPRYY